MFSLTISSPLTHSCIVNLTSSVENSVIFSPENFAVFTAVTAQLTQNFVVTAVTPGSFNISATAFECFDHIVPGSFLLNFLPFNFPLPAPSAQSAQLSNDGMSMYINFNGDTDRAGYFVSFNCSNILSFSGVRYIQCAWLNTSTLVLSNSNTNFNYLPNVGTIVNILSNSYRAMCKMNGDCKSYPVNPPMSVTVFAPTYPIIPTIVLSFPSQIGPCDAINLDATGSYGSVGKPFTVKWSISPSQTKVDLNSYLNSVGSDISNIVTIPNSYLLNSTTFTVTLQLTNAFGLTSVQTKSFIVLPASKSNYPNVRNYFN